MLERPPGARLEPEPSKVPAGRIVLSWIVVGLAVLVDLMATRLPDYRDTARLFLDVVVTALLFGVAYGLRRPEGYAHLGKLLYPDPPVKAPSPADGDDQPSRPASRTPQS